ncbi:7128_t:CDS:1, partial [Racocetra persica]
MEPMEIAEIVKITKTAKTTEATEITKTAEIIEIVETTKTTNITEIIKIIEEDNALSDTENLKCLFKNLVKKYKDTDLQLIECEIKKKQKIRGATELKVIKKVNLLVKYYLELENVLESLNKFIIYEKHYNQIMDLIFSAAIKYPISPTSPHILPYIPISHSAASEIFYPSNKTDKLIKISLSNSTYNTFNFYTDGS